MRVDRPAASTSTATRGACCGPSPSDGSSSRGCGRLGISASRPPAPMRTISARPTGRPAASRSSTMSKPLYLGDLAQPGRPSTGLPSSSAVSSRLPGSTGMPKWMDLAAGLPRCRPAPRRGGRRSPRRRRSGRGRSLPPSVPSAHRQWPGVVRHAALAVQRAAERRQALGRRADRLVEHLVARARAASSAPGRRASPGTAPRRSAAGWPTARPRRRAPPPCAARHRE